MGSHSFWLGGLVVAAGATHQVVVEFVLFLSFFWLGFIPLGDVWLVRSVLLRSVLSFSNRVYLCLIKKINYARRCLEV